MNNCTVALPLLKEFGFTGHFFLIAKRIGKDGYMGWEQIRRLNAEGMIIGSHGFSHEILTNLLDTQIQEELSASKNTWNVTWGSRLKAFRSRADSATRRSSAWPVRRDIDIFLCPKTCRRCSSACRRWNKLFQPRRRQVELDYRPLRPGARWKSALQGKKLSCPVKMA